MFYAQAPDGILKPTTKYHPSTAAEAVHGKIFFARRGSLRPVSVTLVERSGLAVAGITEIFAFAASVLAAVDGSAEHLDAGPCLLRSKDGHRIHSRGA